MADKVERRDEQRTEADKYYSVEFLIPGTSLPYQFRIWNLSAKGVCIVVKDDSDFIKNVRVGDVLNVKYYRTEVPHSTEYVKTQIKHITKDEQGRFKGHTLIGLLLLEKLVDIPQQEPAGRE